VFGSAPWIPTALAVVLAMIAALCFASGAFLQQRAVVDAISDQDGAGATRHTGVGVESFRWLARQRRWLTGWGLIAAGTLLHVSALLLAPVSVVQPIGILAVPSAVLLAAHAAHTRPTRSVVTGAALAVAGTGVFVLLAGGTAQAGRSPVTLTGLLTALFVVAAAAAGLEMAARARQGLAHSFGYASVGAISFGFSSALIRLISRAVAADSAALLSPLVITAGLAAAGALAFGAWAVQQAYASGPAAVVIGVLTVGDPLVAILLSAGLLGEGLNLRPVVVLAMGGCAVTAAAGVRLLATHHPAALPDPAREPARVLAAVH